MEVLSRYGDLNPGPLPYQGSALPLSYNGLLQIANEYCRMNNG